MLMRPMRLKMTFTGSARRAQINQAFIYIAAILVIGAIAVIGSKGIISLLSADCDARSSDFSAQLSRFIDDYSDRGSVHFETLTVPCDAKQVCLVAASSLGSIIPDADPIILDSVSTKSFNVFVEGEFMTPVVLSDKLALPPSGPKVVCMDASQGFVKLKFSGQGRTTIVEAG